MRVWFKHAVFFPGTVENKKILSCLKSPDNKNINQKIIFFLQNIYICNILNNKNLSNQNTIFLVSQLILRKLFLEKFLRKNFNDEIILEPCMDISDESGVYFTNNDLNKNWAKPDKAQDNNTSIVWTLNDATSTQFNVNIY